MTAAAPAAPAPDRTAAAEREHWRAERAYWFDRFREVYRERYGLDPHPSQRDDAATPAASLVNTIQDARKTNPDAFFATAYRTMLNYLDELHDHGFDPRGFGRILEFGVGLGRLLRHWWMFPAELHGCDITPSVLEFSRPLFAGRASIRLTNAEPPLPYEDRAFDYVYANSVFTHMPEPAVGPWIDELARITRAGAAVIVTVFDPTVHLAHLTERELDRATRASGGTYAWGDGTVRQSFRYATDALHRRQWGRSFEVLEIRSQFKEQKHIVLRRRGG